MSEKTVKKRKKKDEKEGDQPTPEETAVAKHLRFNLPTKSCNFMGRKVEYFTGSKAVDFLLDSKWASGVKDTPVLFTDRESVTKYLDNLLVKGFFHRALKVVKKKKDSKEKESKGKEKGGEGDEKKEKKKKRKEKEPSEEVEKEKPKEEKKTEEESEEKKTKKKIKLEATSEQVFVDGSDAYVWIFDPVKPLHYLYGGGLVIAAVAVCLFPLWPNWMRIGTYYASVGGACLVGSVLVIAVLRTILFGIIWAVTLGNLHWWLFPNLLADVSVIDSFKPLYTAEYITDGDKDKKDGKSKSKSKKDKENIKEDTSKEESVKETEEYVENVATQDSQDDNLQEGDGDTVDDEKEVNEENEDVGEDDKSESSSSQGTRDFEVVDRDEVEEAADSED